VVRLEDKDVSRANATEVSDGHFALIGASLAKEHVPRSESPRERHPIRGGTEACDGERIRVEIVQADRSCQTLGAWVRHGVGQIPDDVPEFHPL
jgi:hypothetical protein